MGKRNNLVQIVGVRPCPINGLVLWHVKYVDEKNRSKGCILSYNSIVPREGDVMFKADLLSRIMGKKEYRKIMQLD